VLLPVVLPPDRDG